MSNTKIIAYYKDQVKFYTTRAKRAEKSIKEQQQYVAMGLAEIDPLYAQVLSDEKENVERYKDKLQKALNG